MTSPPQNIQELLIVSVTPQNLERGVLWFQENLNSIKKARFSNPWWRANSFLIEKDLVFKPSEFIRRLVDLGYERSTSIYGRGLFAVRGGVMEVWPVNSNLPYWVEFTGNKITEILERKEAEEIQKPRLTPGFKSARSIEKLPPGSFVVHVDHGIGILRGKIRQEEFKNDGEEKSAEFFRVEYAPPRPGVKPDILYVPTNQKDRLTPYVGFLTPHIHRLGGTFWERTKRKIREDAEKLARSLLALYAKRHQASRPPYFGDENLERELRHTFSFAETEDQLKAEEEILKDLESRRPMDRILCGDVGFGKTEIAIRAALRAITSGKQTVILAPTTVLAAQHEKTVRERFKHLPVEIRILSRLTSEKEKNKTLAELKNGKADLLIGTHRIFSKDIEFKNLGLAIIDEEQRFGVKQKERFKELRSEVDILSLSATPIPRTLSLALAKLRDISILETPPPERKPIETFLLPYSPKIIERALKFEMERGGQIYFLHNRIETIGRVKEKLRRLRLGRPLKLEIIHGRLPEKEILRAMELFREKKCDLLLATTIIENGLDVSSANTLIVDEATRLGLAEAHQLRGRIGRGAEKAFAYFLYRPKHLTEKALDRLEALKEYSELGAGYRIALRDLEIRGAGNILGREQSGAINKVGLNLYCQILGEAIEEMK